MNIYWMACQIRAQTRNTVAHLLHMSSNDESSEEQQWERESNKSAAMSMQQLVKYHSKMFAARTWV